MDPLHVTFTIVRMVSLTVRLSDRIRYVLTDKTRDISKVISKVIARSYLTEETTKIDTKHAYYLIFQNVSKILKDLHNTSYIIKHNTPNNIYINIIILILYYYILII